MYTRLLTFKGATNIEGGLAYLREEALPILNAQHGYRGVTASADRSGAVVGILSLWDTESDRAASDGALGKAREEAVKIIGGSLTVENFEQVAEVVAKPPVAGCGLFITRISMDPASVDDNIAFFQTEVVPTIKAQPGFCSLRNMIDRRSGRGVTGTAWDNRDAMDTHADKMAERAPIAQGRGVSFDETSRREILLSEFK